MSDAQTTDLGQSTDLAPPPPRREQKLADAWREVKKAPWSAKFGLIILLGYIFVAFFAPVLTPYGESEVVAAMFEPRSDTYLLGTDNLGRDMLTRILYGARNTIGIAFLTGESHLKKRCCQEAVSSILRGGAQRGGRRHGRDRRGVRGA